MHHRKFIGWLATLVLSVLILNPVTAKNGNNKSQIIDRGDKVQLNLKNVDIDVIIQYLAKFSGEHYLKDPTAKAKISIMANKPVTRKEAVIILEEALIFNNFTIMKHGLAKYVVPTRFAKQYGIDVKIGKEGVDKIDTANLQMRFFKIEYMGVRKMQTILQTILGKNGQIVPHPKEMMLQVIDTTFGLQRMSELIDKMDVPDALLEMYVLHLENTTAAKMITQLKAIFAKNLVLRGSPNVVEADEDNINFIADDRTNKVIVICHGKYIAQIQETARILDQELGNINQVQLYKVQYAEPEALAKQLTELFPKDALKMLPDERLNSILIISPSDRMIRAVQDMAAKLDMKGAAADGDVRVYYLEHSDAKDMSDILTKLFDKKKANQKKPVSIVPDESTNALVITGSKAQFDEVVAILKKLDIFRAQVLVEAVIVEVQMSYVKSLGINLSAFGGNVGDNNSFGAVTNMGVTPGLGLNFGVVENDAELADLAANQKIKALLRAFKNSNQANVLSAPQILTMDNEEAKIVVGEVVPLPTGVNTALNTGNQTISNFRFEDVGLDLNIKPRITQKETISLDVKLEIKARSSDALFEFQVPIITRRSIDTTVNTRDGDTVVIGGLMRDQKDNAEEKIPLLSRLPLLGKLFRNKERRNQKTNLFVFLTPYVLSDEEELQHITKKINNTMNSSMQKTEFNPLSFEEGRGILAAIDDDEKVIKPIKIDRIRPDGVSESLEPISLTPVENEKEVESTESIENAAKLNTSSAKDLSEKPSNTSMINTDIKEAKALSEVMGDVNPDEVSLKEIAEFKEVVGINDTKKESKAIKMQAPRSDVLKLAGETLSLKASPKVAVENTKITKKPRVSFLKSIRNRIKKLSRDIGLKRGERKKSDKSNTLLLNKIDVQKKVEVENDSKPRDAVTTETTLKNISPVLEEKSASKENLNVESKVAVKEQLVVNTQEFATKNLEASETQLTAVTTVVARSEIDMKSTAKESSKATAQDAPTELSDGVSRSKLKELETVKLERKPMGQGIKNVKQALEQIQDKVTQKASSESEEHPKGDQKFDSLMDKVRSQREKAHLKAVQNQKMMFPPKPRLTSQLPTVRPAQMETFDQLVGNLEQTISRRISTYNENTLHSEKLAREKDEEFTQLVEKLERDLARN